MRVRLPYSGSTTWFGGPNIHHRMYSHTQRVTASVHKKERKVVKKRNERETRERNMDTSNIQRTWSVENCTHTRQSKSPRAARSEWVASYETGIDADSRMGSKNRKVDRAKAPKEKIVPGICECKVQSTERRTKRPRGGVVSKRYSKLRKRKRGKKKTQRGCRRT
jgi:hypothetical protein